MTQITEAIQNYDFPFCHFLNVICFIFYSVVFISIKTMY